jgi:hypothetical protein
MFESKTSNGGKKQCRTCGCPLTLLLIEKRRWEHRVVCARCGEAKVGTVFGGVSAGGRKKKAGVLISLAEVKRTRQAFFDEQDREERKKQGE